MHLPLGEQVCQEKNTTPALAVSILHLSVDVTAGPLSIVCQRSGESGEFPADWKLTSIVPIYKKGVREEPGNYRHVSLTSVPGKIINKITLCSIERHLT